ncbi:MAG: rod shape-determining protein MreC [Armatimonadota bacterium]|nr:rod shape-determining protein MreC [Armatimonadota bacterium]MDR7402429.1 rod shape-determining protein MreC [Armatimonadota bacterium]MDR7404231.1 rod shape-determining protein MreC [Armatimonadota bacterium]MDR7437919.1 rod shape-determining protein MreC [Armatimonadota bacterium]MDR7472144.1 rod shape-determining protein MreC [Armatimonadota bacterium]
MTELIAARRRVAVFVVLFVGVVTLLTTQVRAPDRRQVGALGELVLRGLQPVQVGLARVADGGARLWALYTGIGRVRAENARLREELDRITREAAALREQAAAARRLEDLLGFRNQMAHRAVAARVVARDPLRWYGTVVVDRGSRDGVRRNAPVVTARGVVGRVMEVTPTAARVLLVADSRSAVGALVQRTRDLGVVEGRGEWVLHLRYLSRASQVLPGDLVVTSGLGGVFPRGLVIGQIRRVVRQEGELLLEAEVEPAAALDRVEEVLILVPP